MKEYDEEYRGYLIAYINDYTLTAIYEKTRWAPLAIHENANIGIGEKMPKAERVTVLPLRAREIIDMLIARKAEEVVPPGQTRNQSNDERTTDREER